TLTFHSLLDLSVLLSFCAAKPTTEHQPSSPPRTTRLSLPHQAALDLSLTPTTQSRSNTAPAAPSQRRSAVSSHRPLASLLTFSAVVVVSLPRLWLIFTLICIEFPS
ncbi:hypothetical protein PIB30_099107, partial [Stylosanthes scabra]|nr:hypothetical protein [Stylosanthes scabra]